MHSRSIPCGMPDCGGSAAYKIAAPWSDGRIRELKTYALACRDHFTQLYREAQDRRAGYVPTRDETVGEIGIYRFDEAAPDVELVRLRGLEETCRSWERTQRPQQPSSVA